MKFPKDPCDCKGSGEDRPKKKRKQEPEAPQMSDFEQLRRDTLGAQDRAAYIQGDAMRKNSLQL